MKVGIRDNGFYNRHELKKTTGPFSTITPTNSLPISNSTIGPTLSYAANTRLY